MNKLSPFVSMLLCVGIPFCTLSCEDLNPRIKGFRFPIVGQAQGIRLIGDKLYIFGENISDIYGGIRKVGFIQELSQNFEPSGWKGIFAKSKWNAVLTHTNSIAYRRGLPTFVSIPDIIYLIDWLKFREEGNLDNALIHKINDTEARDGTRVEYVEIEGKWYVATSDYDAAGFNEIRIMDPERLKTSISTSDSSVVVYRFPIPSRIQNLYWHHESKQLVLVGNLLMSRGWKLIHLDLKKAVDLGSGKEKAIVATRYFPYVSELEGYTLLPNGMEVFITSSRKKNLFTAKVGMYSEK